MTHAAAHDPRTTLARPDLAELALEGVLQAERYRPVRPMQCASPSAAVRIAPEDMSVSVDHLCLGEVFDVLDVDGTWAWGRARRDGVVGYVSLPALSEELLEPTHRVAALEALLFDAPAGARGAVLTLNALVTVTETQGGFSRIARLGWVATSDLADLYAFDAEPAAVAENFVGTPFQTAGRDRTGIDASALIQQSLYACGLGCPREVDQQQALGRPADVAALMRGDLVFWPDHVAIMLDEDRLIHADPGKGVAVETLSDAIRRRDRPSACRRL